MSDRARGTLRKKAVVFASVGFFLVGSPTKVLASVLYCTEAQAAGLDPDEAYKQPVGYQLMRFTLSPADDWSYVWMSYSVGGYPKFGSYTCKTPFSSFPYLKSCISKWYMLNINVNTGRFIWSWNFGNLDSPDPNKGDSIRVSVGACVQF